MIRVIKSTFNRVLGRGDAAILMPVMDGPMKPNEKLDAAERIVEVPEIDNLTVGLDELWATSGDQLGRVDASGFRPVRQFTSEISSLAYWSENRLAIGLNEGIVLIFDSGKDDVTEQIDVFCPTALLFWDKTHLIIACGSKHFAPSAWQADLMSKGSSGSILIWETGGGVPKVLLSRLAYPAGLIGVNDNRLIFTEAWQHRLCALSNPNSQKSKKNGVETILSRLPGYPGALTLNADGSVWLAIFAPRNQLVEFVLNDKEYRTRMMRDIEKPFWVAPTLRGGRSFHEPMQWGAVKQLGVLKPWAPVFSYGLAVRLNEEFQPIESLHSRADGNVHGVTSIVEQAENNGESIFAAAKGDGVLVKFNSIK
ncbi:hypothetical protein GN278_07390 [Rhodobacteraceae bacterium Araon29]